MNKFINKSIVCYCSDLISQIKNEAHNNTCNPSLKWEGDFLSKLQLLRVRHNEISVSVIKEQHCWKTGTIRRPFLSLSEQRDSPVKTRYVGYIRYFAREGVNWCQYWINC
jgi:hypothetical protein